MNIRAEKAADESRIRQIHSAAFASEAEADLVEAIRARRAIDVSLVAEELGVLVGHILFSAAMLMGEDTIVRGAALAPLAVEPGSQRRGIGSALVKRGLKLLRERGCPFVVVVGQPAYYHRFGFVSAEEYGLSSEYTELPAGVFMALVLDEDRMPEGGGVAKYRPEFALLDS